MTSKITTEQLIVNDENGIPKGLIVTQATFSPDGSFLAKVRHELSVVSAELLTATANQIAALNQQITTLTSEKAVLVTEKTALETQVENLLPLLGDIGDMQSTISNLQLQLAESNALVVQYRPFDPNVIKSRSFYKRITGDELFQLGVLALTDETAKGILHLLSAYLANEWKVFLDDPQVGGAMQYLKDVSLLEAGRALEITRTASKEEAYTE